MPKIYGFLNQTFGRGKIGSAERGRGDDVLGYAIAEDGTVLGSHLSTNESFLVHDLGMVEPRSKWRHEMFAAHYPDGYETEYVWSRDREGHKGLNDALAAHDMKKKTDV